MGSEYAGGNYVVAASKNGKTEFWAAATGPKQATAAVQLVLGPDWSVKLTNRRLTRAQVAALKMRPDDVRRIGPRP